MKNNVTEKMQAANSEMERSSDYHQVTKKVIDPLDPSWEKESLNNSSLNALFTNRNVEFQNVDKLPNDALLDIDCYSGKKPKIPAVHPGSRPRTEEYYRKRYALPPSIRSTKTTYNSVKVSVY